MPHRTSAVQNTLVQATIFKKCDRTNHKPDSNKGCASGTCQHTCEAGQVPTCAHKWTVRYSVASRQRERVRLSERRVISGCSGHAAKPRCSMVAGS
jgi:hypothetical protein